ncbi:MAG: 5-dehydro-4-deoxy-D-glucuronate isomerase [Candidatus Marinimicrobia bacterium]|nr:5-dehydro-4-deoxy-D-glucuronate isomerase [Candidatus Neomarinimicrobiota bacterium]
MKVLYSADQIRFKRMTTDEIRETFLLDNLFVLDIIPMIYSDVDRAIIGSAVPSKGKLSLSSAKELASDYFAQRRELGVINIGEKGIVTVDGQHYDMERKDGLYIGRGSKLIEFESVNPDNPAYFYILSYPAHKDYPTAHAKKSDAEAVHVGSQKESNDRTIYKYIHPKGIKSCQLVMGFTELAEGSVWNTMPAHTHERRMEVYLYFDIKDNAVVFHLMGKPDETRHIVIRNRQAVVSPSWSIHSGAGTSNYSFIWGMGGENQEFDDMDNVKMDILK